MTDYKFGDVVLVPFPFTDQTTTKKRPAVVVSSTDYNIERPDIVFMAITSQIRPALPLVKYLNCRHSTSAGSAISRFHVIGAQKNRAILDAIGMLRFLLSYIKEGIICHQANSPGHPPRKTKTKILRCRLSRVEDPEHRDQAGASLRTAKKESG